MSLFDPPRPYLNPAIFTPDEQVKPEVKTYLMDLLGKIFPMTKVYSLTIIGSSVGHQYSETSDIDVNVMARRGEEFERWHPVFKKFNDTPNYLPGTRQTINYYFQEYVPNTEWSNSLGAYDLFRNMWAKRPIPYEKIGDPTEKYEREIAYGKMLLNMISAEAQQLEEAKKRNDINEVNRRTQNLALFFKRVEDNRKTSYRYSAGSPALEEYNILYKLIEDSPYGPLMHQLIDVYDSTWNLQRD